MFMYCDELLFEKAQYELINDDGSQILIDGHCSL